VDARDVLIQTLEDVESARVAEDLRPIAFSKVFDLRAGASGGSQTAASGGTTATGGGNTPAANGRDPLASMAAKIGTDRDTVAEVFEVVDGAPALIVPPGKIATRPASGAKEIALLIAGGRQAAGVEEWTTLDVVREVCADFKRLDAGNFAKTIKQMQNEFAVRKESERKTLVRLSRPGWEAFGALVRRLAGGS